MLRLKLRTLLSELYASNLAPKCVEELLLFLRSMANEAVKKVEKLSGPQNVIDERCFVSLKQRLASIESLCQMCQGTTTADQKTHAARLALQNEWETATEMKDMYYDHSGDQEASIRKSR